MTTAAAAGLVPAAVESCACDNCNSQFLACLGNNGCVSIATCFAACVADAGATAQDECAEKCIEGSDGGATSSGDFQAALACLGCCEQTGGACPNPEAGTEGGTDGSSSSGGDSGGDAAGDAAGD